VHFNPIVLSNIQGHELVLLKEAKVWDRYDSKYRLTVSYIRAQVLNRTTVQLRDINIRKL
jgi:hypothetical protein